MAVASYDSDTGRETEENPQTGVQKDTNPRRRVHQVRDLRQGKSDGIIKEPRYHANAIYSILSQPLVNGPYGREAEDTGRPRTGQRATSRFLHLWSIELVCGRACARARVCARRYLSRSTHILFSAHPNMTAMIPHHRKSDYGLRWIGHDGICW